MSTASAGPLTVRAYSPPDEPQVLELLSTALAGGPTGARTGEFFRWKHQDNPFGPSLGLVAEDEQDRIVGVRLVMRWQLEVGALAVPSARMVDTATHPSVRGRGVFRDLTLRSLAALQADTVLVFNTPNSQSRPGYLGMGWHQVGVVPTSFGTARPWRLARGARSARTAVGASAVEVTRCPLPAVSEVLDARAAEVADLLAAAPHGGHRLQTTRSMRFLRWRYAAAPGLDYRAVVVERHGRLVGLGVGRLRGRGQLSELTLSDVVVRAGDRSAARAVLRAARRGGSDHVATHLPATTARRSDLAAAGYLTTARLGLTLTTRPLRPDGLPVDPRQLSGWALRMGDLEVF